MLNRQKTGKKNRQKCQRGLRTCLILLSLVLVIGLVLSSCKPSYGQTESSDDETSAAPAYTTSEKDTQTEEDEQTEQPEPVDSVDPDETAAESSETLEPTTVETSAETEPAVDMEPPSAENPVVALTFDDGPSINDTETLLDTLAEEGVVATFFVLGNQIDAGREFILERTFNEGHEIANHSYSHVIFTQTDEETIRDELTRTSKLIEQVTGQTPTLMRPPTGGYDDRVKAISKEMGLAIINWSWQSCPEDWNYYDNPEHIANHVIEYAENGHIILLHDINSATVESMPKMIAGLKERGFRFMTVSQMFSFIGDDWPKAGEVYNYVEGPIG